MHATRLYYVGNKALENCIYPDDVVDILIQPQTPIRPRKSPPTSSPYRYDANCRRRIHALKSRGSLPFLALNLPLVPSLFSPVPPVFFPNILSLPYFPAWGPLLSANPATESGGPIGRRPNLWGGPDSRKPSYIDTGHAYDNFPKI